MPRNVDATENGNRGSFIPRQAEEAPEKQAERRPDLLQALEQEAPGVSPMEAIQAGASLEEVEAAIYGENMEGLYGIGNYEFIRPIVGIGVDRLHHPTHKP